MCKKSLLMMLLMALFAPWAAMAQGTLTVHDGTTTNGYVPFYGYYADAYNKCEMVYPATELSDMAEGSITGMTFYASQASVSWGCNFQVFVAEVEEATISAFAGPGTVVYEGALAISGNQMTVNFSAPYVYNGGNLLVGVYNTTTGTYITSSWYGESVTGASVQGYSYTSLEAVSASARNFLPKTTFAYVPAGAVYVAAPTNLGVTLTPGDGTVATLAWTENGTATQWEICLNGDETNLVTANTNPYTLTGLTPETAYTAKVRATTPQGNSAWTSEVTFTPTNAYQVTVNDGTATNGYVPIYGFYVDAITQSQFIIPARDLADMAWGTINKMTFYAADDKDWGAAQFEVYMAEVDNTILEALADYSTMTKVMNAASLGISGNKMEVTLDAPYEYGGGNLMIGFLQTVTGTYSSCSWYGVSAESGASWGGYGSSVSAKTFLPKTTFGYIPGEQPTCFKPSTPEVARVTSRTADLAWNPGASETQWQICLNDDETNLILVDQLEYQLTGLTPDTDYTVKMRSYCGDDDQSSWTANVSFTTLEACPAPTDMVIDDITAYSANISWTSENTNFELRYTSDVRPITNFDDSQMNGWTNIDADGDEYIWVLASEAAGVYHNSGVDLTGQGHNSSYDFIVSGSYTNAGGGALTPDNYLVSPRITLGGSISFWAQAQDENYAAEHFGVAVSTTSNTDPEAFTTIAEWTFGSRNTPMFRSSNTPRGGNRTQTEWVQYTVDLSEYTGQGYVAIRHFDCTDQFILNVDDILIEQPGFEMTWVDVPNPTNPQALTNLEPETTYTVQVRANCGGEDGVSEWLEGMFTTLPACMAPTGLTVSNIDKRSADLAWTSNGEETAWQICVNGDEENLIYVTDTAYTLTDLLPDQTRYIVKVRAYCDETLQSAWSSPVTFYTLIACPAPTGLAVADITTNSAVVSWTSETDVELQYAEDVWMHYDNGVFATTMGAGGTIYWGIMLPAESLTAGEPLTKVALHTTYAGEAEMNIYLGGDQPTGTPAATQTFTMAGDGDFMEITLDTPVAIDGTENLWITFYQSGLTYAADGCTGPTDPNGRLVSLDGETWSDLADYGFDYTWMIRAGFGNASTEWVSVENPATPQTIEGLEPETSYLVRLRDVCGGIDGESVWVTTGFTTLGLCVTPENLTVTDVAAYTAVMNWEGFQDSYNVRYGVEGEPAVFFREDFENQVMPDGFVNGETGWEIWNDTVAGTYCIASSNYNVSSTTATISMTATFDAAGTIEFSSRVSSEGGSWDYGYFSIDGTQQYSEGGTTPNTWTNRTFEVSAGTHTFTWSYRKDSSVNNGEDRYFIDNIVLSVSNINWIETIEGITEAPYTLTGLERTTEYFAQVQGVCPSGLTEWSNLASFTTTVSCWQPTELVATDVMADYAILDWTANGEETAWEIEVSDDQEPPVVTYWNATEKPFTLAGLFPETEYSVRVRANCGEFDGYSEWSDAVSFTTLGYCDIPEDLEVGNITFYNATASWTGIQNSYNLKYWKYEIDAIVSENFNSGIPADWANDTIYPWTVTDGYIQSGNAGMSSSTSAISVTVTYEQDGVIEFDAECRGEGTSTYYDHCDFAIDGNRVFYHGADLTNEGWLHYSFEVEAGEHTFTWSYSKDSSVNPTGDYFAIDNVAIGYAVTTEYPIVENIQDNSYLFTDLDYDATYFVQVQGMDENCTAGTEWTDAVSFFFPMPTQTIALAAGNNWVSCNVEVTLNQLKAALVAATPNSTIKIQSQQSVTTYNPNNHRWSGSVAWDLAKMYLIKVQEDCEISLQGYPVIPSEHPVTIANGANWIAFPLSESMTITNAFAGFAISGDKVKSQTNDATYSRRWSGQLTNLVPGQGYIYKSNSTQTRTLVFPSGTSK